MTFPKIPLIKSTALLFFLSLSSFYSMKLRAQWTPIETGLSPTAYLVVAVDAVDEQTAWAVSFKTAADDRVAKTTDGGMTWDVVTVDNSGTLKMSSITAINESTAWVAMWGNGNGGVFKTSNGGQSWVNQPTAYTSSNNFPCGIHFFDANNGLTFGDPVNGYFDIYTTSDGGDNWIPVPQGNMPHAAISETGMISNFTTYEDHIWFGTSVGRIIHSADRGLNWEFISTPMTSVGATCAFKDELNGMVTTYESNLIKVATTSDGGENWSLLPAENLPGTIGAIAYVPGTENSYVIVGSGIFGLRTGSTYTLDGGESWEVIDTEAAYGIPVFASPSVGWVGGADNVIYRWTGPALEIANNVKEDLFGLSRLRCHAYPNPAYQVLNIEYTLSEAAMVRITIRDAYGKEITCLTESYQAEGTNILSWNGEGNPTGIYYYSVQLDGAAGIMEQFLWVNE